MLTAVVVGAYTAPQTSCEQHVPELLAPAQQAVTELPLPVCGL